MDAIEADRTRLGMPGVCRLLAEVGTFDWCADTPPGARHRGRRLGPAGATSVRGIHQVAICVGLTVAHLMVLTGCGRTHDRQSSSVTENRTPAGAGQAPGLASGAPGENGQATPSAASQAGPLAIVALPTAAWDSQRRLSDSEWAAICEIIHGAWRSAMEQDPDAVAKRPPTMLTPSATIEAFEHPPKGERYAYEDHSIWQVLIYEDAGVVWVGNRVAISGVPGYTGIQDRECARRLMEVLRKSAETKHGGGAGG